MPDRLLPLGSVVSVEGGQAKLVIAGYYPQDSERMYDYLAVVYPVGIFSRDDLVMFDAEVIAEVVSEGYQNSLGANALEAARRCIELQDEMYGNLIEALLSSDIGDFSSIEEEILSRSQTSDRD